MKRLFFSARTGVFTLPVLFCLLGLLATPVSAQTYDFVGLVQDGQRGEPIGNVEISSPDGKKLGASQSTGRFEVTVNNRRAHVIFRKQGYKDLDVDLGEVTQLIDVEISMESNVQELADVTTFTTRKNHDPNQAQSIEELESLQGMRIDLNDHLRQLHGVAGMNEYTNDISVNGSRTQDVTHYLGHSRVPSLRHLDFGFPGNQSVLNPRLLKSVTLSDNLAKGPLNQGNASALVYDLRDGDPEAIHGDVVIGSVDDELNMNGYWEGRTLLFSGRILDNNSLTNLGSKFFTNSKEAKTNPDGTPCTTCKQLADPISFTSGDLFFGTFLRDSTGAYARHSLVILSDDYNVQEDEASTEKDALPQTLIHGYQGAWLYSYEAVSPSSSGDLESGFSLLYRNYEDEYHDTLPPTTSSSAVLPWYGGSPGAHIPAGNPVDYKIGSGGRLDWQAIWSEQWSPNSKTFGAQPSYGVELEYHHQNRSFTNIPTNYTNDEVLKRDLVLANMLYRLHWSLSKKHAMDASVGTVLGYQGRTTALTSPFSGEGPGALTPLPLASLRYTYSLNDNHKLFGELAMRQSTEFTPHSTIRIQDSVVPIQGSTAVDTLALVNLTTGIKAKSTSSAEILFGGDGAVGNSMRYAWSGYIRGYLNPILPVPDVFWNYQEKRSSDYARVNGANATLNWLPSHHFGMGLNGSTIQGSYHMKDGLGSLPWESNRTLDVVTNMRLLPRDDSLLSFIFTYTVSNDRPLYEYRGLWDTVNTAPPPDGHPYMYHPGHASDVRYVYQSSLHPEVSRKRVDMRINIDLKSHWRPLESMRFFFEADNIFANSHGALGGWLGGTNQRQRGWSRPGPQTANPLGNLEPVVTRGLGLFIMFGLEGHLKI